MILIYQNLTEKMSNNANGFLLINKPRGITSFRLLGPLKKIFKPSKVGHAGTLDQEARGLMVVAIGKASRLLQYAEAASKVYEFTFHVGRETVSAEYFHEEVIQEDLTQSFTQNQITEVLSKFLGRIQQKPPRYSAVKIDGKRASERARAGEDIELKTREVEIYSLEVLDSKVAMEAVQINAETSDILKLQSLRLRCHCSKGTYIRSLCVDIAREIGLWGSVSDINRTQIGEWNVSDSHPIDSFELTDELLIEVQKKSLGKLINPSDMFSDWLKVEVSSKTAHFLSQGMKQDLSQINAKLEEGIQGGEINYEPGFFCIRKSGELVCFAKYHEGKLAPKVVFL